MAIVMALVLAIGGSFAEIGQAPAPILPEIPAIPAHGWNLGGTSQIDYEFRVDPNVVDAGTICFTCSLPCRGKKHLLHRQCDSSCDGPCMAIHQNAQLARVRLSFKPFSDRGQIGAGLNRFGVGSTADAVHYSTELKIKQDLKVVEEDVVGPLDFEWKSDHWNDKPCSNDTKAVRRFSRDIIAKWRLVRYDLAPDGRQVQVDGPSGEVVVGTIDFPDRQAIPYSKRVSCLCSVAPGGESQHGMIPGNTGQGGTQVAETGVCVGNGETCTQATEKFLEECKFEMVCESMNTCTVSATNPTNEPMVLCVNPGAVCEPDDPNVQNMGVVDRIELRLEAGETGSIEVPMMRGPFDFQPITQTAKGRVLCLNMKKKEPNKNVKFKMRLPDQFFIAELAAFSGTQRFRGSREQVRTWIGTDHATIDEIGKVLLGGASEGTYLMALHEVHFKTSLDATSAPFRRCWQPSLLLGSSVDADTTGWFFRHMSKLDSPGIAKWVRANFSPLAALLASGSKDYERKHVATVARLLGGSKHADVRSAAADFLLKGVPESSRGELAQLGALDGFGSWMASSDPKAAETALSVLEAYRSPSSAFWASNLSNSMPASLKERAKKLLAAPQNGLAPGRSAGTLAR